MSILEANFPKVFKGPPSQPPEPAQKPKERHPATRGTVFEEVLDEIESAAYLMILAYRSEDVLEKMEIANTKLAAVYARLRHIVWKMQSFRDEPVYKHFWFNVAEGLGTCRYFFYANMMYAQVEAEAAEKQKLPRAVWHCFPVHKDGPSVPPWMSWCGAPLTVPDDFPIVRDMKTRHPDLPLVKSQFIPPAGRAIAHYWRLQAKKQGKEILDVARDPPRVQKMIPYAYMFMVNEEDEGGEWAKFQRYNVTPPKTQKNLETYAYDAKDPVWEQAGKLASMEKEFLRGSQNRGVMRTWFKKKGAKEAAAEEESKEDEGDEEEPVAWFKPA